MLSHEENELVTRVGPGTPMGQTMRRYWMPALLSSELPEPDGAPVRVRLLGEDLVAFRTSDGDVGLIDDYCPHRGASMWLGRNEENGLRCVYHGWKFDIEGNCIDQLSEPDQFADKVRINAYPVVEMGGIAWAYMGPPDKKPAPPKFAWTQLPHTHRAVTKVVQECNWLQAMEGGIDTAHFPILHGAIKKNPREVGIAVDDAAILGDPARLEVELTDYGYRYFGLRTVDGVQRFVRGYQFVMPFTVLRPTKPHIEQIHGHYWVPMGDENCMVWNFYYSFGDEPMSEETRKDGFGGNRYDSHVDRETFRSHRDKSNDWMINRDMQKHDTYTGVNGVNQQDRAVQESMGLIVDRSREHLGPADAAIIATRKLLLDAVATVGKDGDPPGLSPSYYEVRAMERILDIDADWRAELMPLMHP